MSGDGRFWPAATRTGICPCSKWTAGNQYRTLQLSVHHTDGDREYGYDSDPPLGSSTGKLLEAAADGNWTVVDMAADWASVFPTS
jgi:hypothetical protein